MIETAPPQEFIGPRCFPIKYLPCSECGEPVRIPDKFRRAKTAVCFDCADARYMGKRKPSP